MAPFEIDARVKALENRISQLENALKASGQTLTLQVGASKIVLTPSEIRLESGGTINVKSSTELTLQAGSNMQIRASSNLTQESAASMQLKAAGRLALKGSPISQN
jgi:hypothetical protein